MEHNNLTIVDYNNEGTKVIEKVFVNGNRIDFITDYSISKKANKLTTVTLTFDCKKVEVTNGDFKKRIEEEKALQAPTEGHTNIHVDLDKQFVSETVSKLNQVTTELNNTIKQIPKVTTY